MPDPIMYQEDGYVVLESDQPEKLMNSAELQAKLVDLLGREEVIIPRELEKFESTKLKAQHLVENYFELDIGADQYLQWYAIRWEK
jgi:Protein CHLORORESPIRATORY REDUCTION 7